MIVNVNTVYPKYGDLHNFFVINEFDDLFLIYLAKYLITSQFGGINVVYVLSNDGFSWFGNNVPDFGFDTTLFNMNKMINGRRQYLYKYHGNIIRTHLPFVSNNYFGRTPKLYVETPRELRKLIKLENNY
jgi:hypothetical protein